MASEFYEFHGDATEGKTPEYQAWLGMKKRCYNTNCVDYIDYGGRGIIVYEEWKNSYPLFLAYVGRKPSPEYSLDRYPNTDGNYEPGNVRWATTIEQSNNRYNTIQIEFEGRTQSLANWARELNMNRRCLYKRWKRNWTIQDMLTIPSTPGAKFFSGLGERK